MNLYFLNIQLDHKRTKWQNKKNIELEFLLKTHNIYSA